MSIIGYKAILPKSVVETIKATAKSPYAGGQKFFSETADMSGITLKPITEEPMAVQRYEFFNPTTPIAKQENKQQRIDFLF